MTQQAVGSLSYIAACDETTYGVAPTAPTVKKLTAMVYGESLGAQFEQIVSNAITGYRAKADVRTGNVTVQGKVPFELSIDSLGTQLKHAIGVPTTSDVSGGLHQHVFKRGALPVAQTLVKWFGNIGQGFRFTGCRTNGLSLTIGNSGAITGDLDIMAKGVDKLTTAYGTLADDIVHRQVLHTEASVTIDGVAAALVSANLTLTNNLDPQRAVGSAYIRSAREGVGEVSGQLTAFFEDVAAYDRVASDTSVPVVFSFVQGDKSLTITIPAAKFSGDPIAKISTDKGLTVVWDFKGKLSIADGTDIIVTLVNSEATV